jgi:hypothetical protein
MMQLNRVILGIVVSTIGLSTPAFAQSSEPAAPIVHEFRGLFGPTRADERRPPLANFTLLLYGAADDNSRFASGSDVSDEALQARRMYEGAQAGLNFLRRRPRSVLRVEGSSALRYYSDLRRISTQKHSGSFGLEYVLSQRAKLQVGQTASFSPYYQLVLGRPAVGALNALDVSAATGDYSVSRQKQMVYGSSAVLTYAAGTHGAMTFGYARQHTDFFESADFHSQRAAARYTHEIGRGVALRLGYGFGDASTSGLSPTRNHDLDFGVDYGRALSVSPRTVLGFTSGTTMVATNVGRQVQLIGSAQLRHQLSRSTRWNAQLSFDRGLQAIEGTPRPFIADTVTAGINGYISRRISLRVLPSYASGVDVEEDGLRYHSLLAQTRLDMAMSRNWAAYVEHFYYRYQFPASASLPSVLTAGMNRQGLRVGLSLWTPVAR